MKFGCNRKKEGPVTTETDLQFTKTYGWLMFKKIFDFLLSLNMD